MTVVKHAIILTWFLCVPIAGAAQPDPLSVEEALETRQLRQDKSTLIVADDVAGVDLEGALADYAALRDERHLLMGHATIVYRRLRDEGHTQEALHVLTWLWDEVNEHDEEAIRTWRRTHAVRGFEELCASMPDARKTVDRLRARAALDRDRDESLWATNDWIDLSAMLNRKQEIVNWAVEVGDAEGGTERLRPVSGRVFPFLIARGHWPLAGRILTDPAGDVRRFGERVSDPADPATQGSRELRRKACNLYGACLAAGRDEDATRVVEELLQVADDAGARIALVQSALRAASPRQEHLEWLDEAESMGGKPAEVRVMLEYELQNP